MPLFTVSPLLRLCATLLLPLLLTGCAGLEGKRSAAIDGRQVEFALSGHAAPAVVFDNGLGAHLESWGKVYPELARSHTVFVYNRPGVGGSAPAASPRDGQHIVDELRALLRAQGLAPPYVLVGHSLGGLYMQLYLRRYPDEVAALVLVDSTHPRQFTGAGAPAHWPGWVRLAFGAWNSGAGRAEFDAAAATGEQVLALPAPAGKPVYVLSARQPAADGSAYLDDLVAKRAAIAALYPGARQVWVDSGHNIPLERPDAVLAAVRAALADAGAGGARD